MKCIIDGQINRFRIKVVLHVPTLDYNPMNACERFVFTFNKDKIRRAATTRESSSGFTRARIRLTGRSVGADLVLKPLPTRTPLGNTTSRAAREISPFVPRFFFPPARMILLDDRVTVWRYNTFRVRER